MVYFAICAGIGPCELPDSCVFFSKQVVITILSPIFASYLVDGVEFVYRKTPPMGLFFSGRWGSCAFEAATAAMPFLNEQVWRQ